MVWNNDFLDFLIFRGFSGFPGLPGFPGFPDLLLFLDVPVFPEFGHRIQVPARGRSPISLICRNSRIPGFPGFPGCPGFPRIRASNSGPGAGVPDGCRSALGTSRCRKKNIAGGRNLGFEHRFPRFPGFPRIRKIFQISDSEFLPRKLQPGHGDPHARHENVGGCHVRSGDISLP